MFTAVIQSVVGSTKVSQGVSEGAGWQVRDQTFQPADPWESSESGQSSWHRPSSARDESDSWRNWASWS
eukprot:6197250-Pyramimonas_sp.AAC.1